MAVVVTPQPSKYPPTSTAPRAATVAAGVPLLPGDVLLTRSTGVVGALIRFGERTHYHGWWNALRHAAAWLVGAAAHPRPDDPAWCNHAAVYVGDGMVIEALAGGLTLSPISKYGVADYRIARLQTAEPTAGLFERQAAVAYARAMLERHCSYGWLSIASIILQLLTPTRLDISWDGAMICSAFAAQCWEHAGVILPTRSSLTTMPADFWRWT